MTDFHPELEQLFQELADGHGPALDHAKDCEVCGAILADHKELERDLFRLADPFPPANFVSQVMAKVQTAPAPVHTDVKTGVAILVAALVLSVVSYVALGGGLAQLGLVAANGAMLVRDLVLGVGHALGALWKTAALPMSVALTALLAASLLALRKLAGDLSISSQKVMS